MRYQEDVFFEYLLHGDLRGALAYLDLFPEGRELTERYKALFESEYGPPVPGLAPDLDKLLGIYRRYYRDVFYLDIGKDAAASRLREGLPCGMDFQKAELDLDELEQGPVKDAFEGAGFHFLGGRTDGFYGPYVWKTTETVTYEVELPGGTQSYTVKLLDGFIAKSWLAYISLGRLGTGGWTDSDGVICCVRASYDLDSEDFRVSLLKHEAQHAWDLRAYGLLPSPVLEFRAKLVELIYSTERNLLPRFAREADGSEDSSGHGTAAQRIVEEFEKRLNVRADRFEDIPIGQIQRTAAELFQEASHGSAFWEYQCKM